MASSFNRWIENVRNLLPLNIKFSGEENTDLSGSSASDEVERTEVDFQVIESTPSQEGTQGADPVEGIGLSAEKIWDLSELDPELAENVFLARTTEISGSSVGSKDTLITEPSNTDLGSTPLRADDSEIFRTPKVQRIEISEDENSDAGDTVETHPVVDGSSEKDTEDYRGDPDDSDLMGDDLFSEAVEVRPHVKKLLQQHGTIAAVALLEEIRSVSSLMRDKK